MISNHQLCTTNWTKRGEPGPLKSHIYHSHSHHLISDSHYKNTIGFHLVRKLVAIVHRVYVICNTKGNTSRKKAILHDFLWPQRNMDHIRRKIRRKKRRRKEKPSAQDHLMKNHCLLLETDCHLPWGCCFLCYYYHLFCVLLLYAFVVSVLCGGFFFSSSDRICILYISIYMFSGGSVISAIATNSHRRCPLCCIKQ